MVQYEYCILDATVKRIPEREDAVRWIRDLIHSLRFEIKSTAFFDFPSPVKDQPAYTITFVLAESHVVIHTAPEENWVELVFAFCKHVDPAFLEMAARDFLHPQSIRRKSFV